MTTNDAFDRTLSTWLHEDAEHRVPDHLDDVLQRTAAIRQRPAWSSLERWLPVNITIRRSAFDRPIPFGQMGLLLLIGLLIAAFVAIAVGTHRGPAPYGIARNGPIAYWNEGDILLADPDGRNAHVIVSGATDDLAPGFSRDGSRLSFVRAIDEHHATVMLANADGSGVRPLTDALTDPDWFDWSSGNQLALVHTSGSKRVLSIIDASAATPMRTLDIGSLQVDNNAYWGPPDGAVLYFTARPVRDDWHNTGLYSIRPDGTDFHPVAPVRANDAAYNGLDVSLDGKTLSYWSYTDDPTSADAGSHIYFLDIASGVEMRMTFDPTATGETDLYFSPDGTQVVFQREDSEAQLMVAPVDGSAPGRIIGPHFSLEESLSYAFSPDGATIWFATSGSWPQFIDVATGRVDTPSIPNAGCCGWQRLAP